MSIFVQKGEPTRHGWKRLKFYLTEYYNPDWTLSSLGIENDEVPLREPHDHEFFTFTELEKMPIRILDKVSVVKQTLIDKLSPFYP